MSLEIEILTTLINAYERSKVSKGQNKIHKDIKLDISHSVFDKHRNNDNGELEIAIQRIERDGFARSSYTRNGQFQCLILNLDDASIDKLYKYLKRPNPKNIIVQYKEAFLKQSNGCQIVVDFSKRMLDLLDDKKLSSVQTYVSSLNDITDICKAINEMSLLEEDVQERIFCAKLFSDSKRFNDLRGKISKVIREFSDEPFDDEEDVIASMGVIKNTAYAFIKGDLVVKLHDQVIDLKEYGEPLALSDSAIRNIEIETVRADSLYTIENLTSFDVFKKSDCVAIYLGGFHNRVKRELIKKISNAVSKLQYFHYGDIDAGGFYILNHLRNKTNIKFEPYMMGIEELKKYKNNCKTLTNNDKKRLNSMLENDGFVEFKDTIKYMLINNIKLEQEAEN
jgi:hypothetical protein